MTLGLLVVGLLAVLILAGIAYSTYIIFDDLDSRMKSTEEDMSTLRGQIGVLLGNKHPGGMRTPDNTERYRDKLEASENNKFQASLAGLFLAPAAAKRKAAVKKKKISQKLNPPRRAYDGPLGEIRRVPILTPPTRDRDET